MEHRGLLNLLRLHWLSVILVTALGGALGFGYTLLASPEYTADTELFIAVSSGENTGELAQGSNYSQQQARNYSAVATREIVLQPVINTLALDTTVKALRKRVSTTVPLNTSLISISVRDSDADRAAATANAIATSLSRSVEKLVPKLPDGSYPISLKTVQSATVPAFPSSPNTSLSVALGLLAGLALAVGGVAVREYVNAKVRTAEQIKAATGSNLLGSIVYDKSTSADPMALRANKLSPRAEEFRQLRTNLRFLQADNDHKVFVLTSSIPGEGKSATAANLAATIAASGASVCLVEADLRRPTLGGILDLEGGIGFTTLLAGEADLDDVLQPWGKDGLRVLLSGEIPPNPSELLGSVRAEEILTSIRDRFDVTIIDCPPLIPVTDATILARLFGGAILVVGAKKVETRELRRAVERMAVVDAPILGTVLNLAPASVMGRYRMTYSPQPAPRTSSRSPRPKAQRASTAPAPIPLNPPPADPPLPASQKPRVDVR
ncbi:polysaccharide biosynthesis tyrosine autokinase [Mycetocola manganoxydans]|uniref:polysaccharide biosynthesis tyrosine autokinase n=1 Tax=Mycetocola manganoxydans TaxID=699879 RepID=UPI0016046CD4|nr:polysaccharide biosynthesis tyrosine autokinase [Mycetocola manganoxydans]GHD45371.1 chromosome partitioning protein [Mycetocola manganoxydans]